ncbi:MAG: DNA methyltransferase [Acetivibrionales bacterium]|jgi:site-specific DNA-methyltransferase (adenine-specific)
MEPTDVLGNIKLYNADCMEVMKTFKDKQFDLAIVDPPYRNQSENQPTKDMRRNGKIDVFGDKPDKTYFDELFRVSKNQIIWGANNFTLPNYKGFVIWKKLTISEAFTMSMAELAYLSEGLSTVSKIFEYAPQGKPDDPRIHPTQKPVQLYKWLLQNYAKEGDTILDTHFGSLSIGIACHDMKFDLTAIELDKDYYEQAKQRLINHQKQLTLF